MTAQKQLWRMLNELGRVSDEPKALTRTFLSPAMAKATARVGHWMQQAGLTVRRDSVGNVIGRLEAGCGVPTARREPRGTATPTFLLGSHLDTVRHAGRFDGALGVLTAIVALAELRRRKSVLPFAVEVCGFSEEEGVRFSSAYLGSKGFTGQLRTSDLTLRDAEGATVGEALAAFNRHRFAPPASAHSRRELLGYCEVHIEQGPVLEQAGLAVGVVTDIAGQTRGQLVFRGEAGHAGTTPMALRRDALTGAAEFIRLVEAYARVRASLVATVGLISIPGGAPNVVPGEARLSLDVRHPNDRDRQSALTALLKEAELIAQRRKLTVRWTRTQDNAAVACSGPLTTLLAESVRAVQGTSLSLVSGAGHDGVVVSAITPITMLFVRCRRGLSHHPDEYASPADCARAVNVLVDFLPRLAQLVGANSVAMNRRPTGPRR